MLSVPGLARLSRLFSRRYDEARRRFVAAATRAGSGWRHARLDHPLTGPQGEPLSLDYAWLGRPDARRVLVTQSATHGVEGFAGSALQIDHILGRKAAVSDDLAILHVHALNPHGFAWLRRVNEDGVDLNRNFVDFSRALPVNPDYDRVRAALLPPDPAAWPDAGRELAALREALGPDRFERAVSGGQYQDRAGMFYGGTGATWSRRALESLFDECKLGARERIVVVDFHTGLGPFGYGELICDHPPGSTGATSARRWFGDSVTEPALGTSSSVPKEGLVDYAWQRAFGDQVCFVTLEFGTYPFQSMLDALRADHWWHAYGTDRCATVSASEASASMRRHFDPDSQAWREAVVFRGRQVLRQAKAGLMEDRER